MNPVIDYFACLLDHYAQTGECPPNDVGTIGAAIEFENWESPHLAFLCNCMRDRYSDEKLHEAREFVLPRTADDTVDWEAIEKEVEAASLPDAHMSMCLSLRADNLGDLIERLRELREETRLCDEALTLLIEKYGPDAFTERIV